MPIIAGENRSRKEFTAGIEFAKFTVMVRLTYSKPDKSNKSAVDPAERHGWLQVIKRSGSEFMSDNCMRLAAALSMYAVLALAPLIVVLVKIASLALGQQRATHMVESRLSGIMGSGSGASAIHEMVVHATQPKSGIIVAIVSFVIVLYSASNLFGELTSDLDIIFDVQKRSDLSIWQKIKGKLMPIGLVLLMAVLMLASVVASSIVQHIAKTFSGGMSGIAHAITIVVTIAVISAMFTLLFKYLPSAKVQWKDAILGGVAAGIGFEIGQYLLSLYFTRGAPTSAYGVMGSLVAVLLWIYYSSQILFFGAELTQANVRVHGRELEAKEDAVKLGEPAEKPLGGRIGEMERERAR